MTLGPRAAPWKVFAVVLAMGASSAQAVLFDHSAYDTILQHYVNKNGGVDYAGISENSESALQSYFERLADAETVGWPRKEKLAFWINAYNAHVIQAVIDHPDIKKISDHFEMFDKPLKIAGHMLTLNDVFYRVLRNTTNPENKAGPLSALSITPIDPRIHFALVPGALSSPKLQTVAYTAENVEDLLKENVQSTINSPHFITVDNGVLKVNSVIRRFKNDFLSLGGWRAYLAGVISEDNPDVMMLRGFLKDESNKPLYFYDWTVNDIKNLSNP